MRKFKNLYIGAQIPKYKQRLSRSAGTKYVADADGWIFFEMSWSEARRQVQLYIDGVLIGIAGSDAAWGKDSFLAPIAKGSTYQLSQTGGGVSLWFIPV